MLVRGQNYQHVFLVALDIHKSRGDYDWALRHQVGHALD